MMGGRCTDAVIRRLTRRKYFDNTKMEETNLKRSLNVFDLTALGVGSTLGAGAYVLSGTIARGKAGPGTIISFLIGAVVSVFAGLCYAEFGGRVPKAGSVYTFSYVTIGEYLAFVIGWDLLLEYTIAVASVARTASQYFDYLAQGKIYAAFQAHLTIHASGLADFLDPLAFALVMAIALILALGVKESSIFNNIFTSLNLCVLTFIFIAGSIYDDPGNWKTTPQQAQNYCVSVENKTNCGDGGFLPFGAEGMLSGAASAFFGYVGFDAIATTGEEVKNPRRNIPLAIMLSLLVIFCFYSVISLTVTMVVPYYELDKDAPLAKMFETVGLHWATYVVSAGALCALATSLLGGMFPLPRVILAMCRDGLLFKPLGYVHPKLKTALPATILMGLLGAVLSLIFDVDALVNMMSIGTLLAYSLVSACAMLLRYEAAEEDFIEYPDLKRSYPLFPSGVVAGIMVLFRPACPRPTKFSARVVTILTVVGALLAIALCAVLRFLPSKIFSDPEAYAIFLFIFFVILLLACCGLVWLQPESIKPLFFKSPLMPLVPFLSIFCNIYLMFQLDYMTWIRFVVWLAIGFLIYICYSWWNSEEEKNPSMPTKESERQIMQHGSIEPIPSDPYTVDGSDLYTHKADIALPHPRGRKVAPESNDHVPESNYDKF